MDGGFDQELFDCFLPTYSWQEKSEGEEQCATWVLRVEMTHTLLLCVRADEPILSATNGAASSIERLSYCLTA
ncbi:hypothetical protein Cni_G09254 [Canna indica]|uniref:Uncharacterized protein n=1 Tax=Canna indica TaxID=4628 RepID=A0AAQ3Q8P4_9LILI|nr:hypothetical protein Cni_G09254 [Canna indica]